MKGYRFYACMQDGRKSKKATKEFPIAFTVANLKEAAAAAQYCECLAVDPKGFWNDRGFSYECAGALQAGNDQAVCGSSCDRKYLRDFCVRIPETLARKLHPALFSYLES